MHVNQYIQRLRWLYYRVTLRRWRHLIANGERREDSLDPASGAQQMPSRRLRSGDGWVPCRPEHRLDGENIVRQLVVSFATGSVIIIERHREALHYARLAESINPYNPALSQAMEKLAEVAATTGQANPQAHAMAIAQIYRLVLHQANFLSILDGFYFLTVVAICGGLIAALQRRIN